MTWTAEFNTYEILLVNTRNGRPRQRIGLDGSIDWSLNIADTIPTGSIDNGVSFCFVGNM
ncbi:hypothetical protein N7475_002364 [Penicillium sp. IBT 31633x]|nr:hypothetical protein N7475_002364 [Penicillium sp. IBT 31633x]